jgi:hypothetical protein
VLDRPPEGLTRVTCTDADHNPPPGVPPLRARRPPDLSSRLIPWKHKVPGPLATGLEPGGAGWRVRDEIPIRADA